MASSAPTPCATCGSISHAECGPRSQLDLPGTCNLCSVEYDLKAPRVTPFTCAGCTIDVMRHKREALAKLSPQTLWQVFNRGPYLHSPSERLRLNPSASPVDDLKCEESLDDQTFEEAFHDDTSPDGSLKDYTARRDEATGRLTADAPVGEKRGRSAPATSPPEQRTIISFLSTPTPPPPAPEVLDPPAAKKYKREGLIAGMTSLQIRDDLLKFVGGRGSVLRQFTKFFMVKARRGSDLGPQQLLFNWAERHELREPIFLKLLRSTSRGADQHYFGVAHAPTFVANLLSFREQRFYEMIRANTKCKLHFDIEACRNTAPPPELDDQVIATMLKLVQATLVALGVTDQAVVAAANQVLVLTDHRPSSSYFKTSWHLVFPELVFTDNHIHMKAFYEEMKVVAKRSGDGYQQTEGGVDSFLWDTRIPTRNRVLRLIGQYKSDAAYKLTPLTQCADGTYIPQASEITPEQIGNTLLTQFYVPYVMMPQITHVQEEGSAAPVRAIVPSSSNPTELTVAARAFPEALRNWAQAVVFPEFARYRLAKFGVGVGVMPDVEEYVRAQHSRYTNSRYISCPTGSADVFCEYKGRAHMNPNPTRTGYQIDTCRLEVYQTCYACPVSARVPLSLSVLAYQYMKERVPYGTYHTMLATLMQGEQATAAMFIREFSFMAKSSTTGDETVMWVYDRFSGLWTNNSEHWFRTVFPNWLNERMDYLGSVPGVSLGPKDRAKLLRMVNSSNTAVFRYTKAMVEDQAFVDQLDHQHHLLPTADGRVVDCRTLESTVRTAEHMFTRQMNFTVVPLDSPDYLWLCNVIREFCLNDDSLYEYLQTNTGYSFTGEITDRKFYTHIGNGANGKNTFMGAVEKTMGQFFMKLPQNFFNRASNASLSAEASAPFMNRTRHARVLSLSELGRTTKLCSEKLKTMASGDTQQARGHYQSGHKRIYLPPLRADVLFRLFQAVIHVLYHVCHYL